MVGCQGVRKLIRHGCTEGVFHSTLVELGTGVVVEERRGRGDNGCNGRYLSKVLSKRAERNPKLRVIEVGN